jgi:hypothetical protein
MLVGFGSGLRFFFSFFFNCGYAKFLSIMGLGSEKMAPNHDYTFNAHYLVLLQHWESCCLLGGIRRFVLSGQLLWGFQFLIPVICPLRLFGCCQVWFSFLLFWFG